jgi:hypothetical protein
MREARTTDLVYVMFVLARTQIAAIFQERVKYVGVQICL